MDTQRSTAKKIIDKQADYILAVKDNQKTLREEVESTCNRDKMVFREDEQRKRTEHAAENFAVIRKIALNILKKDMGKH